MSDTTDLFIFYTYGNLMQAMNLEVNKLLNGEPVDPFTISDLQLFTVELNLSPGYDFRTIKDYLSEVNSTFALWAVAGKPEEYVLYLEGVLLSLDYYLKVLCAEYQLILLDKAGYEISFEQAYFTLTGALYLE